MANREARGSIESHSDHNSFTDQRAYTLSNEKPLVLMKIRPDPPTFVAIAGHMYNCFWFSFVYSPSGRGEEILFYNWSQSWLRPPAKYFGVSDILRNLHCHHVYLTSIVLKSSRIHSLGLGDHKIRPRHYLRPKDTSDRCFGLKIRTNQSENSSDPQIRGKSDGSATKRRPGNVVPCAPTWLPRQPCTVHYGDIKNRIKMVFIFFCMFETF